MQLVMRRNKLVFYTMLITFAFASTVFANKELTPKTPKKIATKNELRHEKKDMMKNTIIGKIDAINGDTMTLSLATRSEANKPEKGKKPETLEKGVKSEEKKVEANKEKGTKPNKEAKTVEKADFEKMFVLTGEKKTINIKNATYGLGKPKEKANDTKVEEEKTISSLQVGDYVMVELEGNNSNVAKKVVDYVDQAKKVVKGKAAQK